MMKIVFSLLIIISAPVYAGKMKDIYISTFESVTSTLGLNEDYIELESSKIIEITGFDLAVRSIVIDKFDTEKFDCITFFNKNRIAFEVSHTKCRIYK